MTVHPILFSGPMVAALLAGTKTQTRRAIKDQTLHKEDSTGVLVWTGFLGWQPIEWALANRGACGKGCLPRFAVGDLLWVRERGFISPNKMAFQPFVGNEGNVGEFAPRTPAGEPYKTCVSIHMPRWASRLTLEVTGVKVEWLWNISEADAIAEGLSPLASGRYHCGYDEEGEIICKSPVTAYGWLWNSINGADSWASDPWVVAVTFAVHKQNVGELLKQRASS